MRLPAERTFAFEAARYKPQTVLSQHNGFVDLIPILPDGDSRYITGLKVSHC